MTTINNVIPFEVLDLGMGKVTGEAATIIIHYNSDGTYDVDAESNFLIDGKRLRATSSGISDERLKTNISTVLQRDITDEEYNDIIRRLKDTNDVQ